MCAQNCIWLARSAVVTLLCTAPIGQYAGQSHSGQPLGSSSICPQITQRLFSFLPAIASTWSASIIFPVASSNFPFILTATNCSILNFLALGEVVLSFTLNVVSSFISFGSLAKLEP